MTDIVLTLHAADRIAEITEGKPPVLTGIVEALTELSHYDSADLRRRLTHYERADRDDVFEIEVGGLRLLGTFDHPDKSDRLIVFAVVGPQGDGALSELRELTSLVA